MSITAFVPARSGSKRLSNKNIKMLADKPLVVWTLEACLNAPSIKKVIFSTDSKEYWDEVCKFICSDRLVLSLRSPEEAGDKVKIFDYLQQNIDNIFDNDTEHFLLALPTMPLRSSEHIEQVVSLATEVGCGVFSAVEYEAPVSFAFSMEDKNNWNPLLETNPMLTGNTRSQDQVSYFHPNGAIYLKSLVDMRRSDTRTFYQDSVPFLMKRSESVDIDTEFDFYLAEYLLNNLKLDE
ncbi:acylneuraminate cytidylyltransferase family protein [Paraglaciecola sp.]|uniref:acylneuraminate cytidylyltransferase family protein n=1 Tax=Paraglaciecola sp. TaxID=1920173 RepID=UPI003266939F